jgi:hypothetical protein
MGLKGNQGTAHKEVVEHTFHETVDGSETVDWKCAELGPRRTSSGCPEITPIKMPPPWGRGPFCARKGVTVVTWSWC